MLPIFESIKLPQIPTTFQPGPFSANQKFISAFNVKDMKDNSLLQRDSDNDDEISCNLPSALDSSLQQTRAVSSPLQPNNRKHHLLTLPAEIRTKILTQCFIKPKSIPPPPDPIYKHRQKLEGYDLAPQVRCVCKQICEEGLHLLYAHNVFSLELIY
jgi:hypothetical protein